MQDGEYRLQGEDGSTAPRRSHVIRSAPAYPRRRSDHPVYADDDGREDSGTYGVGPTWGEAGYANRPPKGRARRIP